jgi:hypothetical protein
MYARIQKITTKFPLKIFFLVRKIRKNWNLLQSCSLIRQIVSKHKTKSSRKLTSTFTSSQCTVFTMIHFFTFLWIFQTFVIKLFYIISFFFFFNNMPIVILSNINNNEMLPMMFFFLHIIFFFSFQLLKMGYITYYIFIIIKHTLKKRQNCSINYVQ